MKSGFRKLKSLLGRVHSSASGLLSVQVLPRAYRRRNCPNSGTRPYLLFSRPGTIFSTGEPILVSVFNPDEIPLEIIVIKTGNVTGNKILKKIPWVANPTTINLSDVTGDIQIVARESVVARHAVPIRSNSITAGIVDETAENLALIEASRRNEHKLNCAVQSSSTGVLTLHDPWIIPGNAKFPAAGDWFPTPVWEGCTSLYNEEPEYYEDPLRYFLNCIEQLRTKGFAFVTWHDLLDRKVDFADSSILLQLDVDGGPRSFLRVATALEEMGIAGTGMLHRSARHWYEYEFEETGIDEFKHLEAQGWAFGYHHNTLTNLTGYIAAENVGESLIAQAAEKLLGDVNALRQSLNIRTLTHHGGNVLNYEVPVPEAADVICVDRNFAPELWRPIKRSFSDGSFTSRPGSLKSFVDKSAAVEGLLFMRCHPFKYGNYPDGVDLAPLTERKIELPDINALLHKCSSDTRLSRIEKQAAWLQSRKRSRDGVQLGYAGSEKPLSARFVDNAQIQGNIDRLRRRRSPGFLRQYPWAEGDPRVIWWRMMSSFCGSGDILNVGAMPPEQKDETLAFLGPDCRLLEVDIDPDRKPDILADFCDPEFSLERSFDHVLLNGLPYFSDPQAAVTNAAKHLAVGGSLLIGAAAASHPERGGLFRPLDRPLWREGLIEHQGESLSLATLLWSFDDTSIAQLMSRWPTTWEAEFIYHYWFVVATR